MRKWCLGRQILYKLGFHFVSKVSVGQADTVFIMTKADNNYKYEIMMTFSRFRKDLNIVNKLGKFFCSIFFWGGGIFNKHHTFVLLMDSSTFFLI